MTRAARGAPTSGASAQLTGTPAETGSASRGAGTTRRERQRPATYDEIVEVARRLLQTPEALSPKAVAAEMGSRPPRSGSPL